MAKTSRSQRARESLRLLLELGLSQKEIAVHLDANQSTISRILNDASWPVGSRLCEAIEAMAAEVHRRAVNSLVQPEINILEYASAQAAPDPKTLELIHAALVRALSRQAKEPSELALPDSVKAAVAQLGRPEDGLYLVMVQPGADRKALLHELRHIADQLESREGAPNTRQQESGKDTRGRAF